MVVASTSQAVHEDLYRSLSLCRDILANLALADCGMESRYAEGCGVGSTRGLYPTAARRTNDEQSPPFSDRDATPMLSVESPSGPRAMQAWSSPLPQSQWSTVPAAYRPYNWQRPPSQELQQRLERPRESDEGYRASSTTLAPVQLPARHKSAIGSTRPRRRPQPLSNVSLGTADLSRLYPQLNPYDPFDMVSDTGTLHPSYRSVSQPNTPFRFDYGLAVDVNVTQQELPRADTFPRSERSPTSRLGDDTSFDSDREASLFAEAMVGLDTLPVLSPSGRHHAASSMRYVAHVTSTQDALVSPIADTPRTRHALQHLASMPEISHVSAAHRQRLQASASGLDLWLPSDAHPSQSGQITPLDTMATLEAAIEDWRGVADDDDDDDDDDELPDYAASQAEAQAQQRVEAARRAGELRRRWDASHNLG